jgi:hypothetical protein
MSASRREIFGNFSGGGRLDASTAAAAREVVRRPMMAQTVQECKSDRVEVALMARKQKVVVAW